VRAEVIERVLAALAAACGLEKSSPAWWVNFRVIDEGSWGSSGGEGQGGPRRARRLKAGVVKAAPISP
jgi:hypothetical protein